MFPHTAYSWPGGLSLPVNTTIILTSDCSQLPCLNVTAISILDNLNVVLLLPFVHLILLALVLFHQLIEELLKTIRVCLQSGQNLFDSSLDENTIDETETFSILR
jgi:hypothetical protein